MQIEYCQNPTQLNSTPINSKQLKSNFVGLDIAATWNPPHHTQSLRLLWTR